jgi:hypothetical protein
MWAVLFGVVGILGLASIPWLLARLLKSAQQEDRSLSNPNDNDFEPGGGGY